MAVSFAMVAFITSGVVVVEDVVASVVVEAVVVEVVVVEVVVIQYRSTLWYWRYMNFIKSITCSQTLLLGSNTHFLKL